jgi:hypothetical protein
MHYPVTPAAAMALNDPARHPFTEDPVQVIMPTDKTRFAPKINTTPEETHQIPKPGRHPGDGDRLGRIRRLFFEFTGVLGFYRIRPAKPY